MKPEAALIGSRPNPFNDPLAHRNSSYAAHRGKQLVRWPATDEPVSPLLEFVHDSFRALVLNPRFACLGARAAVRGGTYRIGLYGEMGEPGATAGLARDLFTFVEERPTLRSDFTSFVACFTGPVTATESQFEHLLWQQLQQLHDMDNPYHPWDPAVSSDPSDPNFSFSFGGRAFFIVGLHPASSRWTRRFAWPTLVFNAHEQFERLRVQKKFERLRDLIRKRDRNLQGSINAMLEDFGHLSEARQYSGRKVEPDWHCPFHPRPDGANGDPSPSPEP